MIPRPIQPQLFKTADHTIPIEVNTQVTSTWRLENITSPQKMVAEDTNNTIKTVEQIKHNDNTNNENQSVITRGKPADYFDDFFQQHKMITPPININTSRYTPFMDSGRSEGV